MKKVLQRVGLSKARFFAYHGLYPEEQQLGTEFFVDLTVAFQRDVHAAGEEDIGNTVNYAALYEIARQEMARPRKLLETVAESMLLRVRQDFPDVDQVHVQITKQHPPFGGDLAQAIVALEWFK